MYFVLLLVLHYGFTSLAAEATKMCAPAEENRSYSFSIKWFPPVFKKYDLAIMKGDIVMATCDSDLRCKDQFDHYTLTRVERAINEILLTNLTIVNVTRRDQALWSTGHIKGTRLLKSTEMMCYLQTFVKPADVQCTSQLDLNHLHIVCSTKKVYPAGKCQFTIKSAGVLLSPLDSIEYAHNISNKEKDSYFQSTCQLRLNLTQVPTYEFSVTVSIYPDLKNEEQDIMLGSTYLLQYNKDAIVACQEKLSEGQIVLCSTNSTVTVAEVPITVVESLSEVKFTTSISTVNNYYPEVKLSGKCNLETFNELVSIQCEVNHHLFQQVKCQIHIKNQGYTSFTKEVLPYKTTITEYNFNIYQSLCVFEVLRTNVHGNNPAIIVTMIATDYNRNTEQNISLPIKQDSNMPLNSDSLESTNIHMVIIISVICFLLVTTIGMVFCFSRKALKNCFKKNTDVEIQEEDANLYTDIIDNTVIMSSGDRIHYSNTHSV